MCACFQQPTENLMNLIHGQTTDVTQPKSLCLCVFFAPDLNLQSARLTTNDLARKEAINFLRAKQTWTASGSSDPMDLSTLGKGKGGKTGKGKGKGDKSAKAKECFNCGKPGHNKNECRNFSATLRKKSVQPDKAGRSAGVEVDPETGKRKPTEGKGTGAVNPAPGLDACLLHEDDSDQDAYLFPLPMVDESNDSPEDLMALSRRVLFDTGGSEVSVTNNVQTRCSNRAIRRNPTASSGRHESCSLRFQVPQHGCWYSENRRKVQREKRDKTDRCCWTGDGQRAGSVAERSSRM